MNNHWRMGRSERCEPHTDFDDPWPMALTELPLTPSQRRAQRRGTLIHCGLIIAGLLIIAYAVWLRP